MSRAAELLDQVVEHSYDEFRDKLKNLINSESMENGSDTPDFMLADYLVSCLIGFDRGVNARKAWYGLRDDR